MTGFMKNLLICNTGFKFLTTKEFISKYLNKGQSEKDNDDIALDLSKKFLQEIKTIYATPPDKNIGAVVIISMWLRAQRMPTDFGTDLELYEVPL